MPHAHHGHVCVVCDETVMLCTRDDCWVPDDWCCLRCEAIIRDEYFQATELTHNEPTQGDSRCESPTPSPANT